ncbi:carboxylate-amine ligase [Streptomyces zagrosensis]|uniref:Putative glutamate--cysteine ligase 2 n=1 Tax=Streptomyces zagrosensis TaxID=1042984 RepID=A0A7W9Q7D2_9ACTN|nr:glutamate--cysteine ligase [Streptomyces zagrosensis]MBB5933892.1 carboxylate-amine ligase [Streptomyces zagrosensis]
MATVGVEEEYLLVDPVTGRLAPCAAAVLAEAELAPLVASGEVQPELLQAQVEVATPVCDSLQDVGAHLLRLRRAMAKAARAHGCRVTASGTPPFREDGPVLLTEQARFEAIQRQAPQLVAEQLVNGMHVHVAVPSRRVGVEVLNRIRVWLPTLIAMAANSPLWRENDTGFASWRTIVFDRWPVSGIPPCFTDEKDYEHHVRRLLDTGVINDVAQIYWQVRLSERYPTVEVRSLDVQLRPGDAVLFAGLVRALVDTAVRELEAGIDPLYIDAELLRVAMWQAARHGLNGELLDPLGRRRPAGDVVRKLLHHLAPALQGATDAHEVTALVHRLLKEGNGADRQRRALADGGLPAVMELIVEDGSSA